MAFKVFRLLPPPSVFTSEQDMGPSERWYVNEEFGRTIQSSPGRNDLGGERRILIGYMGIALDAWLVFVFRVDQVHCSALTGGGDFLFVTDDLCCHDQRLDDSGARHPKPSACAARRV